MQDRIYYLWFSTYYCFLIIVYLTGILSGDRLLSKAITWFKALALSIPVYFILSALFQKGFSSFIDFGEGFHNMPHYLILFATIITAYYIYRTLQAQLIADQEQKKANEIAAFESRFFKFMDYHRENVAQLKYRKPEETWDNYWEGTQVFTRMHYEIRDLLKEFIENSKWNFSHKENKRKAIDFVYQCYFYGAGEDGQRVLNSIFPGVRQKYFHFVKSFKGRSIKTPHIIQSKRGSIARYETEVFYSGHVRRLGHYFRNIYQAIQYVDKQVFLTEVEKYEYIKTFRAQMSVYEQLIFFYNSLSKLGETWELVHYKKEIAETKKENIFKKLLITKYDLIRNTLFNDANSEIIKYKDKDGEKEIVISIKEFYPLINLEHEEECSVHGILPFKRNKLGICRFCFNEKYIHYTNDNTEDKLREYFTKTMIENNYKKKEDFCNEVDCNSWNIMEKIKSGK